jgi:hypothetical protein
MKHITKLGLLIILTLSLAGCKAIENLPLLTKDTNAKAETEGGEEIEYSLEQVVLSKGYQTIEPNVEIVKKKNKIKLLASLGLLESSGAQIDKIVRKGNIVNIHVINETDEKSTQLAVPQIVIDINQKLKDIDDIKFNIINENYKPLSIKLGLNDVINKINSEFKVSANTAPVINLLNIDDSIIWDITYNSIFDRNNPETPLVNLSVEIDANSGNILKSTKSFISSIVDEGHVLDYIDDKYILYRKKENDIAKNIDTESLWIYDIENNERGLLFKSNQKIQSAIFSPDLKSISLVENNDNKRELYIIPIDDAKAYKVIFNDPINPLSVNWKDNNNLYIIDHNESSSIYTYNLRNNETNLVNTYDLNIIGIKNIKSNAIITALEENKLNKKIIFTNNWQDLKFVDYGFNVKFIDENRICYLKNTEKEDKNALYIYDLDTNKKMDVIDLNLSNYSIITENKLLLIEKNQSNNDYTVHGYDLGDEVLTTISNINSDNVYYNIEKNLIYVNLTIPFENEKHELIYAVDLKKLSATP